MVCHVWTKDIRAKGLKNGTFLDEWGEYMDCFIKIQKDIFLTDNGKVYIDNVIKDDD